MTQAQQRQVSVATLVTICTLLGGIAGGILTAYKIGDDRYTTKLEAAEVKADIKSLQRSFDRLEKKIDNLAPIAFRKED